MTDTTSAPLDDRCVIQNCGRTRDAHGRSVIGHLFVTAAQLAKNRPQRADPFRDIKKMTESDKKRSAETERVIVGETASSAKRMIDFAQKEILAPATKGPETCGVFKDGSVCGKTRTHHRGPIGHRFNDEQGRPKLDACWCGKPPLDHKFNLLRHGYGKQQPAKRPRRIPVPDIHELIDDAPIWPLSAPQVKSSAPVLRTNALITDAVECGLRSIKIAQHLRIRSIEIRPEYSIADDGKLLSADVRVHVSMIFPAGDES